MGWLGSNITLGTCNGAGGDSLENLLDAAPVGCCGDTLAVVISDNSSLSEQRQQASNGEDRARRGHCSHPNRMELRCVRR
ncbi:hypothetical protein NL676_019678 [Syzygium grande]|nr:hypothetical protein NL676_019678 [Syzygium grande]